MEKLGIWKWLPALAWMVIIFYFSAQPAAVSTQTSTAIGRTVVQVFCEVSGTSMSEAETEEGAIRIDGYIRKSAHMTEYGILCLFVLFPVMTGSLKYFLNWKMHNKITSVIIFCILYAASDEYHQTFVPGRSGNIKDVCIDSCGVVAGMLIFLGIRTMLNKKRIKGK